MEPIKRGRPVTGRKRTNIFQVRLSDEEHAEAQRAANSLNTTINAMVRTFIRNPHNSIVTGQHDPDAKIVVRLNNQNFVLSRQEAIMAFKQLSKQLIGD